MRQRRQQLLLSFVIFAVLALIPIFVNSKPLLGLAVMTGYYILLAGSWNLLAGFTGQFSFAHLGLAAVGAYSSALASHYFGVSAAWAFPLAGLVATVVGLGLGIVSLRVKGVALPLITFGFAGAFLVWLKAARDVTHGTNGLFSALLFEGTEIKPYVWLAIGLCFLYYVLQTIILTSRWGLYLTAVHDNEAIAEGIGVQTYWVKLATFSYTAFWAGIAGSLYAAYQGIVAPVMMSLGEMGLVVVMVVVAGMGRPFAAIVGAIIIQLISYWTRGFGGEYTMLITASISLGIVLVARQGVNGVAMLCIERLFNRTPERWVQENDDSDRSKSRSTPQNPSRASAYK